MKKIFIISLSLFAFNVFSQEESHCLASEKTLLTGKVGILKNSKFNGNKILSICADGTKSPLNLLTYRFGLTGKVELEFSAPKDGQFNSTNEAMTPHSSVDVLYFNKGTTLYAITECIGRDCGNQTIRLQVFQGKKRIALLDAEPEKFKKSLSLSEISGKVVKEKDSDLSFVE